GRGDPPVRALRLHAQAGRGLAAAMGRAAAPRIPLNPVVDDMQKETTTPAANDGKGGFWQRLKAGLGKTRAGFGKGLADLLVGRKEIDDDVIEELETQLLLADVGVEATDEIIQSLTGKVGRQELTDTDALFAA